MIDDTKCTLCNICTKVCPPNFMYEDTTTIEQVERLYLGYPSNEKIRYESSTAGMAKTLTKVLLEEKIVDAVYSLEYLQNQDEIYGRWITKFEKIPNSIYRPVMWGENLLDIDKEPKKVLLIGLPCQIKGAKKLLEKKRKKFDILSIGLMCRQQKTLEYTNFLKKNLDIDSSNEFLFYRGEGWPGKTGIKNYKTTKLQNFKTSNGGAFGNKLWSVNGCFYCSDCLGSNVCDITLGDPWGKK